MANIIDKTRPEVVPLKPVMVPGMGQMDDARMRGTFRPRVTHPTLPLERTYCNKCGAPYGWTSMEGSEHIAAGVITVLCTSCEAELNKLGEIPLAVAGDQQTTEFERMCEAPGCRKPESQAVHHTELGLVGSHRFQPYPALGYDNYDTVT